MPRPGLAALPRAGRPRRARGVGGLPARRSRPGWTTSSSSSPSRRSTAAGPGSSGRANCARASRRPSRRPATRLADRMRAHALPAVALRPPVGGAARVRRRARRALPGRPADLRRPRLGRRLDPARPLPARRRGPADGGGRRAARLLQPDRPALGQPALRLGGDGARGLRLVGRAPARLPAPDRPGAHRPLPRLRGLLGGAGRRRDRRSAASWVPGPGTAFFASLQRAARRAADRRRGPRRDHRAGGGAARPVRAARHEGPAVRLERPQEPLPAAQLRAATASSTRAPTTTTPRSAGGARPPTRPRATRCATTSASTSTTSRTGR